MSSVQIMAIGSQGRTQCAMREDGEWFVREKIRSPYGLKWMQWRPVGKERPPFSWYDPQLGMARLPD